MCKVVHLLKNAVERIDKVFEICESKGVTSALSDELLTKPAIMKHLDVLQQQFEKLEHAQEYDILSKINKEDLKGVRGVRNISSHDYDSIENEIIENTIRKDLPRLKENLKNVLVEVEKNLFDELQKKIDYFEKKKDILYPQDKQELINDIKKGYYNLQKNGLELSDKDANRLGKILKDNQRQL